MRRPGDKYRAFISFGLVHYAHVPVYDQVGMNSLSHLKGDDEFSCVHRTHFCASTIACGRCRIEARCARSVFRRLNDLIMSPRPHSHRMRRHNISRLREFGTSTAAVRVHTAMCNLISTHVASSLRHPTSALTTRRRAAASCPTQVDTGDTLICR